MAIPNAEDPSSGLDSARTHQAQETDAFQQHSSDMTLILDANNTHISWTASKTLAGKDLNVSGGWSGKFGSQLNGQVIVSPNGQIRHITVAIEFASLWTEHDLLTRVLATDGFFETKDHPVATFISTEVVPIGEVQTKLEGATHWITGNFQLNGLTHSISFAARITEHEQSVAVHSAFSLDRQAFDVVLINPPVGVLLGDDAIGDRVAIELNIDMPLGSVTEGNEKATDPESTDAQQSVVVDVNSLPGEYTETIKYSQVDFEMVLVPGDSEMAIAPFYLGRYEVTWDEFMPWALQLDIDSIVEQGQQRAMKLRPSQPWGQVTRGFGEHRFPALSMSRLAAILYCQWLSEQTGKTYRLPTEAEWEHAYQSGGNSLETPPTEEEAQAVAVYFENCFNEAILSDATRKIGSKQPNSLGLYDMAGNVCEWVMSIGPERVARGGHFLSAREELGLGRHIEDPDIWNMNYPNEPKSIWWYVDAKWVGFRVVCELPSVSNKIQQDK